MNITPAESEKPLEERQNRALEIVRQIEPKSFPKAEFSQRSVLFKLSREFMALGGDVEDYKPAIAVLSQRLGRQDADEDTLWEFLLNAYDRMKITGKRNWIQWAIDKAVAEPVMLPANINFRSSQKRKIIYGACWHLAHHHSPLAFDLSQELLAQALGTTKGVVSIIVDWLVQEGLIVGLDKEEKPARCRADEYYVRNVRCKRYRLCSLIDEQCEISPIVNERFGGIPAHL